MGVVDIVLLWLVGFCVCLYLAICTIDLLEQKGIAFWARKCRELLQDDDSDGNPSVESVASESMQFGDVPEQNRIVGVGVDCEAESPAASDNSSDGEEPSELRKSERQVPYSSRESGEEEEEEGFLDDWEGIERTELEKRFGDAVAFVGSESNAERIDKYLKLELYGLQKVALEGPCEVPPPMALKVSARAKWNSWQSLGNMDRELAMEQYLMLLSRANLVWKGEGTPASQNAGTSDDLACQSQDECDEGKK